MSGFSRPPVIEDVKYAGNAPGKDGVPGRDGVDGKDGAPGKDGRGITRGFIADDGTLVIVYTDGTKEGLGRVVGRDGMDGKDGRDGIDGNHGKDGADGAPGLNGKDGKNGTDGRDGTHGRDGVDGKDGNSGLDGIDGKHGDPGRDGTNGRDGKDGINGRDGVNGKNGNDGKDGRDGVDLTVAPSRPLGRTLLGTIGRLTSDRKPPGPTNTLNIPDNFCRTVTLQLSDGTGSGARIDGLHSCADGVTRWTEWERRGTASVTVDADQANRGLAVTVNTPGNWTCRMIGSPE